MRFRIWDKWGKPQLRTPEDLMKETLRFFIFQDGAVMAMDMHDHRWLGMIYDRNQAEEHIEYSTGCRDLTGRELYVNDVVELQGMNLTGQIIYNKALAAMQVLVMQGQGEMTFSMKDLQLRLIGNIHQPEVAELLHRQKGA